MKEKGATMYFGILFIVVSIIIDQITKLLVVRFMDYSSVTGGEKIEVIKDFFYITSHRNTGAAWGMLSGEMWFFIIITILSLGVFAYLMKDYDMKAHPFYSVGLILLIGGTLGNFIDRIFRHEVVDFLDFYIFGYNFPIFNVADMCLTIGVISIAVSILFGKSGYL